MKNTQKTNAQKKPQPKKGPRTSNTKGDPVRAAYEKLSKVDPKKIREALAKKKK